MNSPTPATEIQSAFLDLALRVGGIIHNHSVADEAAWALARAIDLAFRSTLKSVSDEQNTDVDDLPPATPHPGFVHLIYKINHTKTN